MSASSTIAPHEAAKDLLHLHHLLDQGGVCCHAAKHAGRWGNWRTGDEAARKSLLTIERDLLRLKGRVEALLHAAANTPAGQPLTTYTPPRLRGPRKGARA